MALDPLTLRAGQALQSQRPASPLGGVGAPLGQGTGIAPPTDPKAPDFGTVLERALQGVGQAQGTADAKTMAFLQGDDIPIHDVMVAVTEAEIAVQATTAIAQKAIAAYQEIWRMDV